MTDKEDSKYFNQCNKFFMSIIRHKKYESFSNNLSEIENSMLRLVGQAESYKDLPNCDVYGMLTKIKKRVLFRQLNYKHKKA